MREIIIAVLLLAVVYILTKRKKAKEEEKKPERPKFSPIPVEVEDGFWSCTPEELLDNVSLSVYQTKTMALPVYIYGPGYAPRDKRHWVTLTASEAGKLTEAVITWCLDDDKEIRGGASNYSGTLLAVLANEECDQIIWEINRLISQHEEGVEDELTRYSPKSRIYVSVGADSKRVITIVITPITPGELANYRAEKEAQAAIQAAREEEQRRAVEKEKE